MIKDSDGQKITPLQAAKEVIRQELEGVFYWTEHPPWTLNIDKLTDKERQQISEHITKLHRRLIKSLGNRHVRKRR